MTFLGPKLHVLTWDFSQVLMKAAHENLFLYVTTHS